MLFNEFVKVRTLELVEKALPCRYDSRCSEHLIRISRNGNCAWSSVKIESPTAGHASSLSIVELLFQEQYTSTLDEAELYEITFERIVIALSGEMM